MPRKESNSEYLTVQQFAERAGMHTNTVYRAIREDRIPHKVVPQGFERQTYLIPESALPRDQKATVSA